MPAGTDADALRGSVEQVKLPRASVPGTAVTSLSTVQGKVTTASLVPGEVLVTGRLLHQERRGPAGTQGTSGSHS